MKICNCYKKLHSIIKSSQIKHGEAKIINLTSEQFYN